MMEQRRGLGRGLSALLGEEPPTPAAEAPAGVRAVPIERLHPGRFQPRRRFDEEGIAALADSIAAQGVLQPLLVRRSQTMLDGYEILAGERRWRAAQRAKLHEVPVLVREIGDREALELALVENVQREDLQPLEEAQGYQRLIDEFGYTQEQLAYRVGKSRSHVANTTRLLSLPPAVRARLDDGSLSAGHARALLRAPDPVALMHDILRLELSVRQTEHAVQVQREEPKYVFPAPPKPQRDVDLVAVERELSGLLGLKLTVHPSKGGKSGVLQIRYRSLEQLDEVLAMLRAPKAR
ncbi:MAG TPA: ParB/RepB/Spo0J family partition protein [Stellaceae bacterium]|nr:ParB/RepB/Spo0J family partition protein [Stellaceae bacterium]